MENNKIFKQQENLHAVNVSEAWQELLSIDSSIKYGDSSLVVAVVDFSGIESTTEIVDGEEKVVPVHSVFRNTNGMEKIPVFYRMATGEMNNNFSPLYSGNHGTCVAGLIGAKINEHSVVGVAPNVRLISLELIDPQKDCNKFYAIADLLRKSCGITIKQNYYVYNENTFDYPNIKKQDCAAILNFSIRLPDNNNIISSAINDITIYGRSGLGCIAVVAAGNEKKLFESNDKKFYEQSFQDEYCLQLHKKTIVVGSVNYEKSRELLNLSKDEFSNHGAIIDVVAPVNQETTTSCVELGNTCSLANYVTVNSVNGKKVTVSDISVIKEGVCVCYLENESDSNSIIHNTYVEKIVFNEVFLNNTDNLHEGSKMYYYSKDDDNIESIPVAYVKNNALFIEKNLIGQWLYTLSNSLIRVETQNGNKYCFPTIAYAVSEEDDRYMGIVLLGNMRTIIPQDEYVISFSPIYGDLYRNFSLTSAAAPIVSGIATLILSLNCNLNWLEVREILKMSTFPIDTRKLEYGDIWRPLGYGIINAEKAILRTKMYNTRYDLWIKRSEGDVGTNLDGTVELNVPDSDLKCSPHTINTKISNIGAANSIEGAEIRYLIRFSDLSNPAFEFPDAWMENQTDCFLIGDEGNQGTIAAITPNTDNWIKMTNVSKSIGVNKISIEKILRKCPADKHPYLLVHITPFDYGVTGNSVRTNNNLAYKRDVFLNAEFLQGDGTTRLPNSLPKSETPVPFKINVKMYNKAGAIDLNGMELKVKGFVKKNQEDKEEQGNKNTVFYAKYEGATFRTEIEQNNIVTDISTEVVDRNAQDEVTEVVISGNILISELYKKLQITVTVSNCLNECTHEIRRKSAVFSKFTSALVEDMEFREKIYFFTDCDNLSNTKKYGAISSGDTDFQTGFDRYRITNVFAVEGTQETNSENGTETTNETNSETSTPHKAYAVCKGKILVQEDKDDASLVNIVLKPEMHSSNNPAVKYFVYRGILKSSLYEDDNVVKNNGNSVVSWIEKNIEEPDKRILGVELTDDVMYSNTAPIDNAFYNPKGGFELLTVPAGWCIGTFADNYIGFEIWLDTIGFNPTFSMIRNHETIIAVEQLPMNPTDGDISAHKAQKEQILNYMDPAAYFGNLYDDRIFVRNTNSEASRDGIEYSFEKVKKENLYTQIIDKFLNKNVVYIDIRNEFNTSYNYFGNYGNVLLKVLNNKNQPTPNDCYNCYGNSDWPIIATIFTPSFDDGVVKIAFKKGDNETPLAYAAIGERGRTIAEKIAQGKTNFVDLTAENGDYTDNSVAMVVPFRTNTAPNMENTYISVASYMRIDYLRRMKPTTPNNQETQEPQEQQELPQTPEITENLPVWKQRESSADLLFRPMDMKLPIENVTEGFVVKVYEDEVYIDVPEHQIDYMARMGIARDPDNTYLFAVKSDLHTKNAFQMSNPRFSICSGVNKITKDQFMKYVFGGNYTKKDIKEENTFSIQYAPNNIFSFDKTNPISVDLECILIVISNEKYRQLQAILQNIPKHELVYLKVKKTLQSYYSKYKLYLQKISASGSMDESLIPLDITLIK